ncbi:flagellar biosynthetic protein FliO [Derxia gummosa]|uniref:Flagellar protein n=1 Tax=Derxia gummosa DSM 723 TaxID=1121388 RepID=A0A8B6X9Z4_9BURK|nr:flagellar biosynthetic protein FliO [Derxia gummosa]
MDASYSPWTSVLALGVVLALIVGLGWLLRRLRLPMARSGLPMRTVGALSLGARERLVVVEIGAHWHVLGVTAGAISSVAVLPRPDSDTTDNGSATPNFMAQLTAMLNRAPAKD